MGERVANRFPELDATTGASFKTFFRVTARAHGSAIAFQKHSLLNLEYHRSIPGIKRDTEKFEYLIGGSRFEGNTLGLRLREEAGSLSKCASKLKELLIFNHTFSLDF